MRIAVVHSFYTSQTPSGENEVVLSQLRALQDAGVDVRLFAKYTDSEIKQMGYSVRAAVQTAHLAGATPREGIAEFDPDIVHVHNLFPNWTGGWLEEWTGRVISTLHNFRTLCSNGLLWRDGHDCTECIDSSSRRALQHRCYRDSLLATLPLAFATRKRGQHQPQLQHSSVVIALSKRAGDIFSGSTSARIEVVPNFCERPTLRRPSTLSGWLYVGRLTVEKGIMQLLSQLPSEVDLTVIGDGPLASKLTAEQKLRPNLRYLGHLPHRSVIEEINQAKGLIIPSLWSEGIPTTAIEALSCGKPLIVSNRVAACRELTAGGAGVIYDPATQGSLLAGLASVEIEQERFGQSAMRLYSQSYSPEKWLDKMLQIYRDVIEDRAQCPG